MLPDLVEIRSECVTMPDLEDDEEYGIDYESDADALASAGFGTDEDYNHFDSWDDEIGYRY